MDILILLDRLESVLGSGSRIPLTGKSVVDEHECFDIIDQLRVAIPDEIKQAKRVHSERDRMLEEAEERASRIVAHAQEQAAAMVQQNEIVRLAEAKARRILDDADAEAEERRQGADRYAAQTLGDLEARLTELLSTVTNGLRSLDREGLRDRPMKLE